MTGSRSMYRCVPTRLVFLLVVVCIQLYGPCSLLPPVSAQQEITSCGAFGYDLRSIMFRDVWFSDGQYTYNVAACGGMMNMACWLLGPKSNPAACLLVKGGEFKSGIDLGTYWPDTAVWSQYTNSAGANVLAVYMVGGACSLFGKPDTNFTTSLNFVCGPENAPLSVQHQPNDCFFNFTYPTPAACDPVTMSDPWPVLGIVGLTGVLVVSVVWMMSVALFGSGVKCCRPAVGIRAVNGGVVQDMRHLKYTVTACLLLVASLGIKLAAMGVDYWTKALPKDPWAPEVRYGVVRLFFNVYIYDEAQAYDCSALTGTAHSMCITRKAAGVATLAMGIITCTCTTIMFLVALLRSSAPAKPTLLMHQWRMSGIALISTFTAVIMWLFGAHLILLHSPPDVQLHVNEYHYKGVMLGASWILMVVALLPDMLLLLFYRMALMRTHTEQQTDLVDKLPSGMGVSDAVVPGPTVPVSDSTINSAEQQSLAQLQQAYLTHPIAPPSHRPPFPLAAAAGSINPADGESEYVHTYPHSPSGQPPVPASATSHVADGGHEASSSYVPPQPRV